MESRKKEKKVSLKYALNDRANPVYENKNWGKSTFLDSKKPFFDAEMEENFPLYLQLTFNTKTMRLPPFDQAEKKLLTRKEFEENYRGKRSPNEAIVRNIIKKEVEIIGIERYSFKGISSRVSYFYFSPINIVGEYVVHHIKYLLEDILTHKQYRVMEEESRCLVDIFRYLEDFKLINYTSFSMETKVELLLVQCLDAFTGTMFNKNDGLRVYDFIGNNQADSRERLRKAIPEILERTGFGVEKWDKAYFPPEYDEEMWNAVFERLLNKTIRYFINKN